MLHQFPVLPFLAQRKYFLGYKDKLLSSTDFRDWLTLIWGWYSIKQNFTCWINVISTYKLRCILKSYIVKKLNFASIVQLSKITKYLFLTEIQKTCIKPCVVLVSLLLTLNVFIVNIEHTSSLFLVFLLLI